MTHSALGRLTFGIYPGSAIGDVGAPGPPDRPARISQALRQLQGAPGRPFLVRAYDAYTDPGDTGHVSMPQTPARYERYLGDGRALDLVVQYHSRSGDVDGYCAHIEKLIDRHGEHLATLQVGEEANVTGNPSLDGAYPRVTDALIAGVRAARDKARGGGHPGLKVGCNSSPLFGPGSGFFTDLTRAGGEQLIAGLDYIGLDLFPDVFRPIAPASLAAAVQGLLEAHRRDRLAAAGLGHLPLVITEHGWPTGPGRPAGRQAEVLATVIGVVSRNAQALNITGYIHHTLRDARSAGSGILCQFGLMTDDYTPKPAFGVYRSLIEAHHRP
ncbi:MAG TPA: hypothetical protein VMC83_33795 [Streptosporangiaceae bacterium]|nr:hypothetical protein [Streptosporangiaceae bacterium]